MSIWKDSNGSLHDDMGGAALSLQNWPQGMTKLTAAQADAIQNPPLTLAQVTASLIAQTQSYIDSKAVAKGYDSANSCISYLNSANLTWKAEAASMLAWRDAVWSACYANAAKVTATTTWAQLLLLLPAAPW